MLPTVLSGLWKIATLWLDDWATDMLPFLSPSGSQSGRQSDKQHMLMMPVLEEGITTLSAVSTNRVKCFTPCTSHRFRTSSGGCNRSNSSLCGGGFDVYLRELVRQIQDNGRESTRCCRLSNLRLSVSAEVYQSRRCSQNEQGTQQDQHIHAVELSLPNEG